MKRDSKMRLCSNGPVNALNDTLFIMGDFPAVTQTFILREMQEMNSRGTRINVMAQTRIERDDLDPWLKEVFERAVFFDPWWRLALAGLSNCTTRPIESTRDFAWALSLPHRTRAHRARFFAALVIAVNMAESVRRSGYRYIHAHFAGFQTEVAMCLSRLTGVPFGSTWHAYDIWRDRNLLAEKIEAARVIVTCTEYNARFLKKLAPAHQDKIRLIYHGLNLDNIAKRRPIPDDDSPHWLAVGRLIPKKGFEYLIEAAAILKNRQVPFRLSIVGDGEERKNLEHRIRSLSLCDRVELLGQLRNRRIFEMLQTARGLVQPSVRDKQGELDGIPNTIIEAMAMARPVIGSNISGIPETVMHEKNGFLVTPKNPMEIASAMELLSTNLELAIEMGRQGRCLVQRKFDVKRNADAQMNVLFEAAERTDGPENGG